MNDVEKTNIERQNSGKRMRRRRRMMSVYVVIVILFALTAGITMCFTFLFNVDEIVISGESETYTYMEIVEASGIRAGDNLLRLDTKEAEKQIKDNLLYVETAEIHRDFPSTIRISVTRCIPAYNVKHDDGVLLVSRQGKILSDDNFYSDIENLPIIYGFDPSDMIPGNMLKSENENKYDAFTQIISRFDRDDNTSISSIDITSEYDIVVNYRNGLVFNMGNWSDVEYKLDLAQNVMNDSTIRGKKGSLVMVGSNQCSFRSNGEAPEEIVTTTAPPVTDESGSIITTTVTTTAVTTYAPPETTVDYNYDYGYTDNYDYTDNNYDYGYTDDYNYGNDYGYDYGYDNGYDYGYNDDYNYDYGYYDGYTQW